MKQKMVFCKIGASQEVQNQEWALKEQIRDHRKTDDGSQYRIRSLHIEKKTAIGGMANIETSKEHQGKIKETKMLLANTRSVKEKPAELHSLTADNNIICQIETHLDCTVQSKSIIADPKKTIQKRP